MVVMSDSVVGVHFVLDLNVCYIYCRYIFIGMVLCMH